MIKLLVTAIGVLTIGPAAGSILGSLYGNADGRRSLPAMPRRINGRSGTGPSGFLATDDTLYDLSRNSKLAGGDGNGDAESDPGVITSAKVGGTFTTCLSQYAVGHLFFSSTLFLFPTPPRSRLTFAYNMV